MQKLEVFGASKLKGQVKISGSKNATLPILAASILAEKVKLTNIPLVKDIYTMLDLLKFIGISTKIINNKKFSIFRKFFFCFINIPGFNSNFRAN